MRALWTSVVGKLWMTIIALVTVVLLVLTFLLVQFFNEYYSEQQESNLQNVAEEIATIYEAYASEREALHAASHLVQVSEATLVVSTPESPDLLHISADPNFPYIHDQVLFDDEELARVLFGETVVKPGQFPMETESGLEEVDVMMVAVPIMENGRPVGAIFLYQTLDIINETANAAKQIILYSAVFGILMTTVFAFFLSTRITNPLRQMKKAARRISDGDFDARVPIRSHDEIGDLAKTFNHMARRLNDSIQALSHEKEHLSGILRSMVDGVVTLDTRGEIILMNPPAEKMLRTWKYAENGQSGDHKLPKRFLEIFEDVLESGQEQVEKTVSAQGRFWTIAIGPLYDQRKIRGVVAVIRDVTEEKRLDKLRKDFVANVSHELRTPLSMLQGYSEALMDNVVESREERKEMSQVIHDESLRMGRLVNELLDLAKMEAGHIELKRTESDLSPIVSKTLRKFTNLAREEGIELADIIDKTKHEYEVDADRIEQIFTNLIDNAIRHTPSGGRVAVSLNEDDDGANLTVQDTGHGIAEEDLPFIFERFYKADKARTRDKATGNGIGLAIVKHLVEAHEGHIQVHSEEGKGTIFSIQFPKRKTG